MKPHVCRNCQSTYTDNAESATLKGCRACLSDTCPTCYAGTCLICHCNENQRHLCDRCAVECNVCGATVCPNCRVGRICVDCGWKRDREEKKKEAA